MPASETSSKCGPSIIAPPIACRPTSLSRLIHRAIEKKLKSAGLDLSATEALFALKSLPVVDIALANGGTKRCVTHPTQRVATILRALGRHLRHQASNPAAARYSRSVETNREAGMREINDLHAKKVNMRAQAATPTCWQTASEPTLFHRSTTSDATKAVDFAAHTMAALLGSLKMRPGNVAESIEVGTTVDPASVGELEVWAGIKEPAPRGHEHRNWTKQEGFTSHDVRGALTSPPPNRGPLNPRLPSAARRNSVPGNPQHRALWTFS